jgi:hypothetical protein
LSIVQFVFDWTALWLGNLRHHCDCLLLNSFKLVGQFTRQSAHSRKEEEDSFSVEA